jgi:hypothetical protein
MWLNQLLARHAVRTAPRRSAPVPRRSRLALVQFEDRTVPSNFTAASVADLIADINAANQTVEADSITLVPGTTFKLTAVDNTANGATGLPVIAATEDLTILGNGDTIARSGAKGTPAFRLFDVAAGATLTLENMTLTGGLALGGAALQGGDGGAIDNRGTLTLHGVTIQGNTAQGYDGVTVWGEGVPGGDGLGGGIYSSGAMTMTGCSIVNNQAIGGRGGDGGFIQGGAPGEGGPMPGAPGGNGLGGGLYVAGGTVTLLDTAITGNSANGGGGGSGSKGQPHGAPGQGIGGGVYFDATTVAGLDPYTRDHFSRNHASTSDTDIHGSYAVIP